MNDCTFTQWDREHNYHTNILIKQEWTQDFNIDVNQDIGDSTYSSKTQYLLKQRDKYEYFH